MLNYRILQLIRKSIISCKVTQHFIISVFIFAFLFSVEAKAGQKELMNNSYNILAGKGINSSTGYLSLEQRIECQKAVEEIYWNHRIWPKENRMPRPSLEQLIPDAQLKAKVEDILIKSNALEQYWKRPITGEQLQKEMERIASSTKNPGMLKELWGTLHNDPHYIAECLARPLLADRLIKNWFAYDERIHGALKKRIEDELIKYQVPDSMKMMSGYYKEIEFVEAQHDNNGKHGNDGSLRRLNEHEWNQLMKELLSGFNNSEPKDRTPLDKILHKINLKAESAIENLPLGRISTLKEYGDRFSVYAILSKDANKIKIAAVIWKKVSFEEWWQKEKLNYDPAIVEPRYAYSLLSITDSSCTADTWKRTAGPPDSRYSHTAIWTGTEMIIWGGTADAGGYLSSGSKYNPATDTWTPISELNAPAGRDWHTAVWTGTEMIVWGGYNDPGSYLNSGGRYNPVTDSWISTSSINAPAGRMHHTAAWSGTQMIIWGGSYYEGGNYYYLNSGGRYNPTTNTWIPTSTTNVPLARDAHTAVWSGTEMIVWGGGDDYSLPKTGGKYNPVSDSWTPTSTANAPPGRYFHSAVWTGTHMIIWGGNVGLPTDTGNSYNPVTNAWTSISQSNAPYPRDSHTAVWTGTEMIIWGGICQFTYLNSGGRYNPATNTWIATSTTGAPHERCLHSAVWTGTEMIVWGGHYNHFPLTSGGRYKPAADSWVPTSANNAPSPRIGHSAAWTGAEMIIWAGVYWLQLDGWIYNDGAKYSPDTDSWVSTSIANAPSERAFHTAVWTGTEMIVWGGTDYTNYMSTGGRYNPGIDSWYSTSLSNAPAPRSSQTAVWTGSEMIIWGGSGNNTYYNTGSRYDPASDSWTATSIINVPDARASHTAVWTGSDMIIWGGFYWGALGQIYLNTGGKYNTGTDSWTATSTINAPHERDSHTAVWTGSEMIIWGGRFTNGNGYYLNSGSKYDVGTDSWTETATANVPSVRSNHTAVWTGNKMIVWGGLFPNYFRNTGAGYDPNNNTWVAVSTVNAPSARYWHTAVWTGNEMIIWGGEGTGIMDTGGMYCACPPALPPASVNANPTSPNQVTVGWSTVDNATGYNVYRRYDLCGQQIEELIAQNVNATTYIDNTVSGNVTYHYSITALTPCESEKSAAASVVAIGDCMLSPCFIGVNTVHNNETDPCALMVQWTAGSSSCASYPDLTYTVYKSTDPNFVPGTENQIATCVNGTSYIDNQVADSYTFYYIVRTEDSRTGGSGSCNGGNIENNLVRKGNSPTGSSNIAFQDDFESGLGNWGISANWNWNTNQSHSPSYSAHSGNFNNQCDILTLANFVAIPANVKPQLNFWTYYWIQGTWDGGIVEASSNGNTWRKLSMVPDYPASTNSDTTACIGINQKCFTGYSSAWNQHSADLSAYAGGNAKIRYTYASTNGGGGYEGWYIDDVQLLLWNHCTSSGPFLQPYNHEKPVIDDSGSPTANGMIETDENVMLVGTLENIGAVTAASVAGDLSTSDPILIDQSSASYPDLPSGASGACTSCYRVHAPSTNRPATHWDFNVIENASATNFGPVPYTYSYHVGKSFSDVPVNGMFYKYIETLLHSGVTAGCTSSTYCPSNTVSREQMAKFVCAAMEKSTPGSCIALNCVGYFIDVPITSPFCPYIEELRFADVLSGCQSNPSRYCPNDPTKRQAMAKFMCLGMNEANPDSCIPTSCTGIFSDVLSSNIFCGYIEGIYNAGVVSGCQSAPLLYCPTLNVSREQMSKFIVNAFGFAL